MADKFESLSRGLDSPGGEHFLITPDDANDLAEKPRSIYVGGSGNIAIRMNGVDVIYNNVSGILPVRADRVLAAGTTATNIIGLV